MFQFRTILAVFVLVFVLAGCASMGDIGRSARFSGIVHSEEYIAAHPELSDAVKQCILEEKVMVGMTADELRASWGRPTDTNVTAGTFGHHEQWVYRRESVMGGFATQYVYLEGTTAYDMTVKSWQSPK